MTSTEQQLEKLAADIRELESWIDQKEDEKRALMEDYHLKACGFDEGDILEWDHNATTIRRGRFIKIRLERDSFCTDTWARSLQVRLIKKDGSEGAVHSVHTYQKPRREETTDG